MKDIDWANLPFGYMPTDYNVRCYYRNGEWGEIEVSSSETINLHMAATCLHYGQEAFEGQKAFRCPDGKIRAFRLTDNAERMQSTCRGILMPELPTEKFVEMVRRVVKLNERFIPPYESGAALYIRPLLIGTGAQVGVRPADEYLFIIFVTPVGPYFKGGFAATTYVITRAFDRAAPHGTGRFKVGGNYAASLPRHKWAPGSSSILPSITNKSLQQIAKDLGLKVEVRPILEEELSTFEEAGACGTAAVISPIGRIDDPDNGTSYQFSQDGQPGPVSKQLYTRLRNIQYGIEPDPHGWVTIID